MPEGISGRAAKSSLARVVNSRCRCWQETHVARCAVSALVSESDRHPAASKLSDSWNGSQMFVELCITPLCRRCPSVSRYRRDGDFRHGRVQ